MERRLVQFFFPLSVSHQFRSIDVENAKLARNKIPLFFPADRMGLEDCLTFTTNLEFFCGQGETNVALTKFDLPQFSE